MRREERVEFRMKFGRCKYKVRSRVFEVAPSLACVSLPFCFVDSSLTMVDANYNKCFTRKLSI